jgi:hypothetical protein
VSADPADLPLHAQKAVIGRLLGFHALEPHLARLESARSPWTHRLLADFICCRTDQALADPDCDEPLDSFLSRLAKEFEEEAGRILDRMTHPAAEVTEAVADVEQGPPGLGGQVLHLAG